MWISGKSERLAIILSAASVAFLAGCAPRATQPETPNGVSANPHELDSEPEPHKGEEHGEVSPTAVLDAARPFTGYRRADDLALSEEELLTFLASADAICIGERHDNALDHYGQLRTIEGFLERRPMRGFELGVALEMVGTSEQETLNSYMGGRIETEDLPGLLSWKDTWGFSFDFYRYQLQSAQAAGSHLIALGVERSLTRSIAKRGVSELPAEEQRSLPELDRSSASHRALFNKMMEGHPGEPEDLNNYYDAQLVWEESMARTAADWLSERQPGRKLLILAGAAHCHESAIVERLAKRSGLLVTNLLVVDSGKPIKKPKVDGNTEEQIASGYDYQMVFQR